MPHIDHWYNGNRLVSVTELQSIIAKPFLDKWRQSLCKDGICGFDAGKAVAEEAAELGNAVHEVIANYLTHNGDWTVEGSHLSVPWSKKIILKLKEMNVQKYLIQPESNLIDNESNLAGSPDFVCEVGAIRAIGDLKIKNSLDALTGLQGAGYRYLIKRKHNVDIDKMLIIWAKKKTQSMLVEAVWIDLNEWTDTWYSLVKLWNKLNPKRQVVIIS